MEPDQPQRPDAAPQASPGQDAPERAYERFTEGQDALDAELGPIPDPPRPSRKAAWLAMGAVAVALGLLMLAPGVSQNQASQPAPNVLANDGGQLPDSEEGAADALAVGKPAPLQFTMQDMNGVDVKLASFKGKVILINFWATWCGPCREEIPSLVELQQAYGERLVILGVSIDDPLNKLKPYATKMHMNYPVLVGKDRPDVEDAFGPFFGIPVSVFVDRDGNVWKKHAGIASKDQFEREIKALL